MARGKNKPRRSSGFSSQTLYKYIRLAAVLAPAIAGVVQHGFTKEAAVVAGKGFTGIDFSTGQFNWMDLAAGWTPALAVTAATYGLPKLAGIIRGL